MVQNRIKASPSPTDEVATAMENGPSASEPTPGPNHLAKGG